MGTDISSRLLETAIKKNPNLNLMVSDVLKLPIRSNSCDAVICIALLHHLSTK